MTTITITFYYYLLISISRKRDRNDKVTRRFTRSLHKQSFIFAVKSRYGFPPFCLLNKLYFCLAVQRMVGQGKNRRTKCSKRDRRLFDRIDCKPCTIQERTLETMARYIRVEVGRELVLFAKGDYVKRIRDDRNKKGNAAMESDQGLDAPSFFACALSRAVVIIVDIDNFR